MANVKPIEDICWELFGGSCGVYKTLEDMVNCPRKIRECDVFVPAFLEATKLRLGADDKKGAAKDPKKDAKPDAKPDDKKKDGGKKK